MNVDRTITPIMGTDSSARARRRILVVEDDKDQAAAIAELLGLEGYEVTTVSTGAAAVSESLRAPPAVILLDVTLPDMNGLLVTEALAGYRRTCAIPIILVSAIEDLAARVRRSERVGLDFLRKPYRLEEILARVEQGLAQAELRERLHREARFDDLTGLGNTRLLEERLQVEAARASRYGTSLSIAMMDIDKMKAINDEFGHLTGNAALSAVGAALREEIRDTDVAIRYGGDEFVVLLPHTDVHEAKAFAHRMLARARQLRPSGISLSLSIGVAAVQVSADSPSAPALAHADEAMYRAKKQGGDRIEIALVPPPAASAGTRD